MLCTVAQVKAEMLKPTDVSAAQEADILNRIRTIEAWVRRVIGFSFLPTYEAKSITAYSYLIDSVQGLLTLPEPLMSLSSVTNDGTALVIGTDVFLHPLNMTPAQQLRLNDGNSSLTWYPCGSNNSAYNTIVAAGLWGYRSHYSTEAFIDSNEDIPVGGINASVQTMTLSDVDGIDARGLIPRLSAGNLIGVTTSGVMELMEVTNTNTTTNVITVRRGARGTTAAPHTAGDAIMVFVPEDGVAESIAFDVASNFAQKGLYTGKMTTGDGGTMSFSQFLTGRTYSMLQGFAQ